jgi:6-phosphogluconolactonase
MKRILTLATLLSIYFHLGHAQELYMIAGTYTTGKSEGIYVYRFDPAMGIEHSVSKAAGIKNPSFLALAPDGKHLYAVSEANGGGDAGKVFAYAFDRRTGALVKINEQASGGDDPCHLTVDRTGKWVIVGNYSSGSLSVLPVNPDGGLSAAVSRIAHEGSGPNKSRQERAHVHETLLSKDNKFVYVPDLGVDKVYIYAFDARSGKLTPASQPFVQLPASSGPRHIVFHNSLPYAYLVQELTGTVTAFQVDRSTGTLTQIQGVSTLPADSGTHVDPGSAEIQISPDGRFLYASNRGAVNTIAIYAIDKGTGKLTAKAFPAVQGKHPRYFCFDPSGKWLLVANRDSDEVVVFSVDRASGMISDSGRRIPIGAPVCLLWADILK